MCCAVLAIHIKLKAPRAHTSAILNLKISLPVAIFHTAEVQLSMLLLRQAVEESK